MKSFVTKEQVQDLLQNNDRAVIRGVVAIYERQTADEQSSRTTKHQNGVGFNGRDAGFFSGLAKQILEWQVASPERRYPRPLSPRQLASARRGIFKYAGQLARIANEKIEAEADAAARRERDELLQYEQELQAERAAIMGVERPEAVYDEYDAEQEAFERDEQVAQTQYGSVVLGSY